MAKIKPFRGIRYNEKKIQDFTKVVAPPYDVINEQQRDTYYNADPLNVIRLILAKGEGDQRYKNASETYFKWINTEVLIQDLEPSIYPYYQQFVFEGSRYNRKGFIATVKVENFETKTILPHEQTFRKHKEDRLKLTTACNSNLSQVFSVYSDREGKVEKLIDDNLSEPIIDITTEENIKSSLWKISDSSVISEIEGLLEDKSLLIADGHHRYETSINYSNQQREKNGDSINAEKPYDYVMMYLSRGESSGLIINPTHRVVKNTGLNCTDELIDKLKKHFHIQQIATCDAIDLNRNQISIITKDEKSCLKLTPRLALKKNYENLGVMLLHNFIVGDIIDEKVAEVKFSKFHEEVVKDVREGDYELGFLLPKLSANDIFNVVLDGVKMPHKTTYFYPKILSGLVFNPLW